jgi:hypothetical protein
MLCPEHPRPYQKRRQILGIYMIQAKHCFAPAFVDTTITENHILLYTDFETSSLTVFCRIKTLVSKWNKARGSEITVIDVFDRKYRAVQPIHLNETKETPPLVCIQTYSELTERMPSAAPSRPTTAEGCAPKKLYLSKVGHTNECKEPCSKPQTQTLS